MQFNRILNKKMQRQYSQSNLHKMLQMITLNSGCWHSFLESYSCHPQFTSVSHRQYYHPCLQRCPYCTGSIFEQIKPISRSGICQFLVSVIISSSNTNVITPEVLSDRLYNYTNVGRVVYGRSSSLKAESTYVAQLTVLQLIASNIIAMNIEEGTKPVAICFVTTDRYSIPNYTHHNYWNAINHFE